MTNKTNDRLSDKFLIPLLDNEGNFSTMYIDMFLDSIGFKKNRGNSASDLIIYERQGMRLEHVVVDIENLKKFERFPHMLYTKSDGQLDTEEFMEAYKLSFSLHALYNLNLRIIKSKTLKKLTSGRIFGKTIRSYILSGINKIIRYNFSEEVQNVAEEFHSFEDSLGIIVNGLAPTQYTLMTNSPNLSEIGYLEKIRVYNGQEFESTDVDFDPESLKNMSVKEILSDKSSLGELYVLHRTSNESKRSQLTELLANAYAILNYRVTFSHEETFRLKTRNFLRRNWANIPHEYKNILADGLNAKYDVSLKGYSK